MPSSQRHQDYVFSAPPLAVGGEICGLRLQLDADQPFELRSMAARVPYTQPPWPLLFTQSGLQFISARWSGPGNGDYRQQDFVPLNFLLAPYFGQQGLPRRVYPPVVYPANGVIVIDLRNDGPFPVTGLQLFFRGVKLYPPGSFAYTYPAQTARPSVPFTYPQTIHNLGVAETRLNQPFEPESGTDFAFRSGSVDHGFVNFGAYEVFVTLKDESWKPYSNAPVHVEILFGVGRRFPPPFPCGAQWVFSVPGAGPEPGLLVPEIYLPHKHKMWFDVQRAEVIAGLAPLDYPLAFGGEKVFPG